MANLAGETKDMGFRLEQVQDFTPTPMTVATIIYYTGLHPYTLRPVYTAKTEKEKKNQHLFFFWYKKENRGQILSKLKEMRRPDLIKKLLEEGKKETVKASPVTAKGRKSKEAPRPGRRKGESPTGKVDGKSRFSRKRK